MSSADNAGAPVAGVPEPTYKSRRMQVAVSLWAGWVALYVPYVYNLAIYPFATALLSITTSLQCSHAKAHGLDLHSYAADVSLPSQSQRNFPEPKASVQAASPNESSNGILGFLNDGYTRLLSALTNATRGLPDRQPIHSTQSSSPNTPNDKPNGSTKLAAAQQPQDPSIHAVRNFVQPYLDAGLEPPMPECWGHRGASGVFPENTMKSFERAVEDGSEGLETDVHITADNVICMFHDPSLERTTDGHGLIQDQNWYGGIENVRTVKEPVQQIPRFEHLCDLMMRPDCRHVKANIDIKPENDPERLFSLMGKLVRNYPNWETDLAPRILLGLWHPKFIPWAVHYVPELTRMHIGGSPSVARQYFWPYVDGFSMQFASLMNAEGQAFMRDAKAAGKKVTVWTVNLPDEMIEACRWGVDAVLTDNTALFHRLRQDLRTNFIATEKKYVSPLWAYTSWRYYSWPAWVLQTTRLASLEMRAKQPFSFTPEQRQMLEDALQQHSSVNQSG